jgi:hypothetical protein
MSLFAAVVERIEPAKRFSMSEFEPPSDAEVEALGFLPTPRGWYPVTDEARSAVERGWEARRSERYPPPRPILGALVPCIVCADPAEPSLVGTPTCSFECTAAIAGRFFSLAGDRLRREGSPARTPAVPKPKPRPIAGLGAASVERARERLGSCRETLERYGHRIRGRKAFCPFHLNERTPAMSLHEFKEVSRAYCFGCGWKGDAIDLEAALAGEDLPTTIKRWGT